MAAARQLVYDDFAGDLRSEHVRQELRSDWGMAVLYRWPGAGLAWLCHRAGLGPVGVTLLGLLIAATMPMQALWAPLAWAPWGVALAGALFQALDCADGTLARVTGRRSALGADLDFFTGMAQWVMLYSAIGVLADRTLDTGGAFTALGAVAAAMRLLARIYRDRVQDRVGAAVLVGSPEPVRARDLPVIVVSGLSGLIPFLALSGDSLPWSVAFLIVYSALDIGDALLPMTSSAYPRAEE